MSESSARETWRGIRQGSLRLLFVSPERLLMEGLIEALQGAGVRRLAVDVSREVARETACEVRVRVRVRHVG